MRALFHYAVGMMLLPWRGRTNKKAFLERCQRAVQEKFPEAQVAPAGELELDVVFPDGTRNNLYLGRAYDQFCRQPREFDDIVARWLQMVAARAQAQPIDPDKLVPMIKDREWVGSLNDASSSWIEDYNEQLVVAYAEYKAGFYYCSLKDTDEIGVSREDLRRRALANLAARSTQRQIEQFPAASMVNVGGNFEASQILLDDFWAEPQVGARSLVAVPDRDTLAVSLDDSPQAVWSLAEMAARLTRSEPYPITSLLFARPNAGPMRAIDVAQQDDSHPIPRLDVIDVNAIKRGGGADQVIVIASPLDASPRSVFRLFTKIDGYLNYLASEHFREECGPPSPASTRIVVRIHSGSAHDIFALLEDAAPWVQERNARLEIRTGV
jgi:hypothetical protein